MGLLWWLLGWLGKAAWVLPGRLLHVEIELFLGLSQLDWRRSVDHEVATKQRS